MSLLVAQDDKIRIIPVMNRVRYFFILWKTIIKEVLFKGSFLIHY